MDEPGKTAPEINRSCNLLSLSHLWLSVDILGYNSMMLRGNSR